MRKLLTFAGLVILGSVVGCQSCGTGCSSCGNDCGGSGCGGSGCGGSGAWSRHWDHRACTTGVCDCEIPPLAPYGRPAAAPPLAAPGQMAGQPDATPQVAAQSTAIPREMPPATDTASK
jgi:hypothetical protein